MNCGNAGIWCGVVSPKMANLLGARTQGLLLAVLMVICWLLSLVSLEPQGLGLEFLVLGLGALALELLAPRLPNFGFAGAAFVLYLGCGINPGIGPAPAAAVAGVALLLRSLVRRHSNWWLGIQEAATDGLPTLGSLLLLQLFQYQGLPWMAASLGTVGVFIPSLLSFRRAGGGRSRVLALEHVMSLTICGALLSPGLALAPVPLLLMTALTLHLGLTSSITVAEARSRGLLELRLRKTEQALAESDEAISFLHQGFRLKDEQCRLLEATSAAMVAADSLEQALEQLLEIAQQLLGCRSIVFFVPDAGRMVPLASLSPEGGALLDADLQGQKFSLIESAWAKGSPRMRSSEKGFEIALKEERFGVAFPVGRYGVLYCGRCSESFSEPELKLLTLLTDQARLALFAGQRNQRRNDALNHAVREKTMLRDRVSQLDVFLETSLRLLEASSTLEILEMAGNFLPRLLPAEAGLIACERHQLCFACDETQLCSDRVATLLRAVREDSRPLVVSDFSNSVFPAPLPGASSLLAVPLRYPEGGVLLVFSRQVGRYSLAEQERLRLFSELVSQAVEKKELQERLARASKLAAVGQLAAGMAHEINNPLAAVGMGIETASQLFETAPDVARKRLLKADQALGRVRVILDKLLMSSRASLEPCQRPLELGHLLKRTTQKLAPVLSQASVDWSFQIASEATTLGDEEALEEMLTQLILNARDALLEVAPDQRKLRLELGIRNGGIRVAVEDTGVGLEPEHSVRVFEPFFTTKSPGKGTGLGLSVCQDIARKHGGAIHLETATGSTRFVVGLPSFQLLTAPSLAC